MVGILGEAAQVDDAELRTHRGPAVRRRLAAVVEAGPGESAGQPVARAVEAPPLLRRLAPRHHAVVAVDGVLLRVGDVFAARGDGAGGFRAVHRAPGVSLVERVRVLQVVVEADDVERVRHALLVVAVHRRRHRAGRVELVAARHHRRADAFALRLQRALLQPPFLVADRPQDDRRRVAVALHHGFELLHATGAGAHVARLAHHHHAHAVAGRHPFGRGHVVRGAHGVAAHALQHAHAERLQLVRQRRAHARVVLVVAGALDLQGFAVEEEATPGIERRRADAERELLGIARGAIDNHLDQRRVEMRFVGRPEHGRGYARGRPAIRRRMRGDRLRGRRRLRHHAAGGIRDAPLDRRMDGLPALVLDHRGQFKRSRIALDGRTHHAFPAAEVHGVQLGQPDVAVDARALVEPAVAEAGVDAQGDDVPAAVVEEIAEVEAERRVAVVVPADEAAVDEQHDVAHRAVELDPDAAAAIAGGKLEGAPVPAHAGRREAAAQRLVAVRGQAGVVVAAVVVDERQLHRPVVRQVQRAPAGVVEIGRGDPEVAGLGKVALAEAVAEVLARIAAVAEREAPVEVEQPLLARRHRRLAMPHGR